MSHDWTLEIGVFAGGSVAFTGFTPRERDLGGAEYCAVSMSESLARLGHKVTVFTPYSPEIYTEGDMVECNTVQYVSFNKYQEMMRWKTWDLFIVSRAFNQCSSPMINAKQLWFWAHDIMTDGEAFLEHAYPLDRILCLSEYHRKQFLSKIPKNVLTPEHITVTRNGVDLNLIQSTLCQHLPMHPLKDGKFGRPTFLYGSRPERGLLYLLRDIWPKLLEKLPDAHLLVAGYDVARELLPEPVKAIHHECQIYLEMLQQSGSVTVLGPLKRKDLFQYMAACHGLLSPHVFPEISGLVFLECQALGTPCFTTNYGALPETVRMPSTLVFDIKKLLARDLSGTGLTPDPLTAITDYIQNYDSPTHVVSRGLAQKLVQAEHDWDVIAEEWEAMAYAHFEERAKAKPKRIIQNLIYHSDLLAAKDALNIWWDLPLQPPDTLAAPSPEKLRELKEMTKLTDEVDSHLKHHHEEPEQYGNFVDVGEAEDITELPGRMRVALDWIEDRFGTEIPFRLLDVGCVVGSTKIDCPRDLQKYPDGIPIQDLVGKTFWTYSWSEKEAAFVVRKARNVHKTGRKKEVWKLTWRDSTDQHRLDPVGELIATPDHKVMLSDGTYRRLDQLKKGDSLVPLRREWKRNWPYTKIMVSPGKYANEHRVVYYGLKKRADKGLGHVHHDDQNPINNHPDNLEWKTVRGHMRHHMREDNPMSRPEILAKMPRGEAHHMFGKGWVGTNPMDDPILRAKCMKAKQKWRDENGIKAQYKQCEGPDCTNTVYIAPSKTQRYCSRACFQAHRKLYNHSVVSVEFYGYEDVYDMTVEDTHNYVANEIVIHNCGTGRMLYHVLKRFPKAQVMGVDFSHSCLERAVENLEKYFPGRFTDFNFLQQGDFLATEPTNGCVHCGTPEAVHDVPPWNSPLQCSGFESELPDVVWAGEWLEHQTDLKEALEHVNTWCKPGGMVIYSIPFGPWEALSFGEAHTKDGHEIRFHVSHFEHRDIEEMFKDCEDLRYEYTHIQRSAIDNSCIGQFVVSYTARRETQFRTPDYRRKFQTTRPYVTIGACLIAKNEEHNILRALKPLSKRVDCIYVGDTGSTDSTIEFAVRYAQVRPVSSPLTHGFDTARNEILEVMVSREDLDWIYWGDADEVLLDSHKIRRYLRGDLAVYEGFICTQNHLMLDMISAPDLPVRLFRNRPYYRFHGRIHEHNCDMRDLKGNTPIFPTLILSDVKIAHYGYTTELERRLKSEDRNLALLHKDREDYPDRELGKILFMRDYTQHVRWHLERHDTLTNEYVSYLFATLKLYPEFADPEHQNHPLAYLFYQEALKVLGTFRIPVNGIIPQQITLFLRGSVGPHDNENIQPRTFWVQSTDELRTLLTQDMNKLITYLDTPLSLFGE